MTEEEDRLRFAECCVCGGAIPLLVCKKAHLETPWGIFRVHFHEACTDKDLITAKLYQIAQQGKKNVP